MPIVFYTGTDPVAAGLVASLNRPGTNLTGSALLSVELMPKRLQLLRELIPGAVLFGVLGNSVDLQAAARTLVPSGRLGRLGRLAGPVLGLPQAGLPKGWPG